MEWTEAEKIERGGEWPGRWLRGYAGYAYSQA